MPNPPNRRKPGLTPWIDTPNQHQVLCPFGPYFLAGKLDALPRSRITYEGINGERLDSVLADSYSSPRARLPDLRVQRCRQRYYGSPPPLSIHQEKHPVRSSIPNVLRRLKTGISEPLAPNLSSANEQWNGF